MRTHIVLFTVAVALSVAAAPASALFHTLQVEAHGQCHDGQGNGGGGDVYVYPAAGNVDAVDAEEAQSVAEGLTVFAQGSADQAAKGNPGGDACAGDDTNADGDETHDSEDHVSAEVYWLEGAVVVGVCYDDEGAHATADCHAGGSGGGGGGYSVGAPALP